jgi:hypothetical protein
MANPTPEQIRLYRHRRKVTFFILIGFPVVGFISGVTLVNFFHDSGPLAIGFFFGSMILSFIGSLVFQYSYFRCPVCSHALSLPRRFKVGEFYKGHCSNCKTDYAA